MKRLDDLALSLSRTEGAIALIGLGSVGLETHRMDDYSDIDFFVIVKDGRAESFIKNVSWLTDTYPVAYLLKIPMMDLNFYLKMVSMVSVLFLMNQDYKISHFITQDSIGNVQIQTLKSYGINL